MPSPLRPSELFQLLPIVTMTPYEQTATGSHQCTPAWTTSLNTGSRRRRTRMHSIPARMVMTTCPSFLQGFLCLSVEPSVARNSTRSFLWQRRRSTRWSSAANFHADSLSPPAASCGIWKRSKPGLTREKKPLVPATPQNQRGLMSGSAKAGRCATRRLGSRRDHATNTRSSREAATVNLPASLARLTSNAARAVSSIFRSRV